VAGGARFGKRRKQTSYTADLGNAADLEKLELEADWVLSIDPSESATFVTHRLAARDTCYSTNPHSDNLTEQVAHPVPSLWTPLLPHPKEYLLFVWIPRR
jgi:hypothetical protein